MYIFLIIWFVFLVVYIIFNIYGLYRVVEMRFKCDAVGQAIIWYLVAMVVIIFVSLAIISHLDWSKNLSEIIKIF